MIAFYLVFIGSLYLVKLAGLSVLTVIVDEGIILTRFFMI